MPNRPRAILLLIRSYPLHVLSLVDCQERCHSLSFYWGHWLTHFRDSVNFLPVAVMAYCCQNGVFGPNGCASKFHLRQWSGGVCHLSVFSIVCSVHALWFSSAILVIVLATRSACGMDSPCSTVHLVICESGKTWRWNGWR